MTLNRLIVLLAMACAFATPAAAARVQASPKSTGKATLVKPLSLLKLGDLDFGRIASGATAGTVTVNPNNDARTSTGGVTLMGGTPLAARFISYGTQGSLLIVTRTANPILVTRVGGTETMLVDTLILNGPTVRAIAANGTMDLRVGATLSVAANQVEGNYVGDMDVFVNYF